MAFIYPKLTVQGRFLLDRCGNTFLTRGYEQRIMSEVVLPGGSFAWLMEEISLTGANAVRFLPEDNYSVPLIGNAIAKAQEKGMLVDLHAWTNWFARSDVKAMLQPYLGGIVATIFGEPSYDDRVRWKDEAKAQIRLFRAQGYQIPIMIIANNYGRDLMSLLQYGTEIQSADPSRQVYFCWQAYWNAWWMGYYGMNFQQAAQAIASAPFPIQAGITYEGDPGTTNIDYPTVMALADQYQFGWLYWHYHNRPGLDGYNISTDGYHDHLMTHGNIIIHTDTHSFDRVPPTRLCDGAGGGGIPSAPTSLVASLF